MKAQFWFQNYIYTCLHTNVYWLVRNEFVEQWVSGLHWHLKCVIYQQIIPASTTQHVSFLLPLCQSSPRLTHPQPSASRNFQSPSGNSISLHCLCLCNSPTFPFPRSQHGKIKSKGPDLETKVLHREFCSFPLIWVGAAQGVTATPSFYFVSNMSCWMHNYTGLL